MDDMLAVIMLKFKPVRYLQMDDYKCVDNTFVSTVSTPWLVTISFFLEQQNQPATFCLNRLKNISIQMGVGIKERLNNVYDTYIPSANATN